MINAGHVKKKRAPLIITGVFGTQFTNCYDAIDGLDCIFFSNNERLKKNAEAHGWTFRLVESQPLSADPRISSLQSKYIKFLQFFTEFKEFQNREDIFYFDHKLDVKIEHVEWIENRFIPEKSIFIRNTPRPKTSVIDEINDAMLQKRYAESMPQTIQWIQNVVQSGQASINNRIMSTGLLYYRNYETTLELTKKTYQTCWLLAQPECQIIWGILSQKYEDLIQRGEWSELHPTWKTP